MSNTADIFDLRSYTPDEDGTNFDDAELFVVRRRDMSFMSDYFRRITPKHLRSSTDEPCTAISCPFRAMLCRIWDCKTR